MMIKINGLYKSYAQQVLLSDVSLQINKGEKIGLVGRNGYGKTTLLRMLAGMESPDKGEILIPKDYKIAYVKQHLEFSHPTILEEVSTGLPPEEKNEIWKAEKVLNGLGFTTEDMQRSPYEFSGGFQVRLNLAKVLISDPDLLLLDEPNNYLDIISIRWMIRFLRSWKNELILITHDRSFMDQVVTHCAAIYRTGLKKIKGDTSKMYEQIVQEEEVYEKTRVNDEKERKRMEQFITRFRAKARLASQAQSRMKALSKRQKLEALSQEKNLDFSFHYSDVPAKRIMEIKNLTFSYDNNITPLISKLNLEIHKDDRIAVIGRNGKGKSTLLKLITGDLEMTDGEIKSHPRLDISYYAQTNTSTLTPHNTVEQEMAQSYPGAGITEVRSVCGAMMFEGDAALKQISVLSGGEKSRVLLAKIIARPTQMLLLDEPDNHLDMQSCDALLEALDDFPGAVIMVTHNEMMLRHWAQKLLIFESEGVSVFNGDYEDFLANIGWEEENTGEQEKNLKSSNPKLLRKQKAEHLKKIRQEIGPLEKKVKDLEDEIHHLEKSISHKHDELIKASREANSDLIILHSKELKDLESKKESLYASWEESLQELEDKKQDLALAD